MNIASIGEFGLIRRFSPPFQESLPGGTTGIGDDCAVMPWKEGRSLLVTTDMLVEEIHFLRERIPPRDLGYKALAVNLSDIAAMGGTPETAYLSIGLPGEIALDWMDEFFLGLRELADEEEVYLLGGDTTRSPAPLIINVAVLGTVNSGRVKYRSDARLGDTVCVTGRLGDSGAGLRILLEKRPMDGDASYLLRRHHRPRAHVGEGCWLGAREEVHAMMDVSDGIDSDMKRIMERSRCGARIDLDRLPLSEQLERSAVRFGWDPEEIAATGGEDYCLLATVDSAGWPDVARGFEETFGRPLAAIGSVTDSSLVYLHGDRPAELGKKGFNHFTE
ncbi:MAG: thiamine-phosphate kinase [Bacteroidota bacterium]